MYSMTGYGRASAAAEGRTITVELKSVNHRFLDLSVRTPRSLAFLEDLFREELTRAFSRGHIDVFTNYVNERADARTVHVNAALIASYVAAAREANEVAELRDDLTLSACLRLPEVVEVLPAEEDAEKPCRSCAPCASPKGNA